MRYADDFCVLCESEEDAQATQQTLSEWLKIRGLTFSTQKTRISHLSEGFDFLGMNIRLFKTKKKKSGLVLLIRPSKKSVSKIQEKLRDQWRTLQGTNIEAVVGKLNPLGAPIRSGGYKRSIMHFIDRVDAKGYEGFMQLQC